MKKALLGATLLALTTGIAHAQNVTLYGLIDMGLLNDHIEGVGTRNALDTLNAPSRFGLRGQEDLGGGLKAIFALENGFSPDTGMQSNGGRLFGREAYVGLQSERYGTVRFGRTANLGQRLVGPIASPFGLGYGLAAVTTTFAFNDTEYGAGRVDNAIYAETPSMAGFQVLAGYSFNTGASIPGAAITTEQPGTRNNNRLIDAAVTYTGGPLKAIVHYMTTLVASSATAQRDPKSLIVAASYDFGAFALNAGYSRIRNAQSAPSGTPTAGMGWLTATRHDDNAYAIGGSMPLGKGRVMAGYQRLSSAKLDIYGLGYNYNMSKRTSIYAFADYGETRNFTTGKDVSRRQLGIGMVHTF